MWFRHPWIDIEFFRSREQSPTRKLNFSELEEVIEERKIVSLNKSAGLEKEFVCQNYEDLKETLDVIKELYNQSTGSKPEVGSKLFDQWRASRLIDELKNLLDEAKGKNINMLWYYEY